MFYVELKSKSNNKDIYEVSSFFDCRVKFESPYPKREIFQCINCQQYGHTKTFCFRKARCVKYFDHEIIQPSTAHAERNPRTLNACRMKTTTKIVWFIYKEFTKEFFPNITEKSDSIQTTTTN